MATIELNWQMYRGQDPYPEITASLLSSHDIHKYAKLGCLVSDYNEDQLLPAGYQFRLLGNLIHWRQGGSNKSLRNQEPLCRSDFDIGVGVPVVLPRNSISYLEMKEEFRMPEYIAARFNLRITQVHQGILLGTGPLVDPGYHGKLLVPLHNLTNNDYWLMGGESLIHVEFTKLGNLPRWNINWSKPFEIERAEDDYVEFDKNKKDKGPNHYFRKSSVTDNGGVVSNLSPLTKRVDASLKDTEDTVKELRYRYQVASVGGAIAVVVGLITVFQLVASVTGIVQDTQVRLSEAEARLSEVKQLLKRIQAPLEVSSERQERVDPVKIPMKKAADAAPEARRVFPGHL